MSGARDALKGAVGALAERLMPALGREIDEDRQPDRAPRLKRAILLSRLRRAQARGDASAIETTLAAFWRGGPGDRFHDRYAEARFRLFLERHAGVIDTLAAVLAANGGGFSRLVEIGCGDGTVLDYCAGRLSGIKQAVGLDINAAVIAKVSSAQPSGGRLTFVHAEAGAWLADHPLPGTVLLSNGGVLEYLSQTNFDRLLEAIARAAPAAVVLIEPVSPDHDLSTQTESFPFGAERSFSHNHAARLAHAGFAVAHQQEMRIDNVRWMLMIGLRAAGEGGFGG